MVIKSTSHREVDWEAYAETRIGVDWLSDFPHHDRLLIIRKYLDGCLGWILDAGCGVYEPIFIANSPNTVALDLALISLKNLKKLGFKGHLLRGSITHLPFKHLAFNKTVASEVIEHLFELSDVDLAIKEVERVSKNFLITTPNCNRFWGKYYDSTHFQFFDKSSLSLRFSRKVWVTTSNVPRIWFLLGFLTCKNRYIRWLEYRLVKRILWLYKAYWRVSSRVFGGCFLLAYGREPT
jgi:hypothetical protein